MIILFLVLIFIVIVMYLYKKRSHEHFIYIGKSKIHGNGIFINKDVKKGDIIFKAIDHNKIITKDGSMVNHCNKPTTNLVKKENGWYLISNNDHNKGTEMTADYNYTPDFIIKPKKEWTC